MTRNCGRARALPNNMSAPPFLAMVPFGVLLALIALGPIRFPEWWARHYLKVAFALGAGVVSYYLLRPGGDAQVLKASADYVRFIALVGSLFVVSGGIHLTI